uniref:uncharacterized protein LOC109954734 n=1 Tax=Monopterus albus TaxID=43700 RepID=UPI0009B3121A|nr:uncharacterized protein LOC109954734 [Monopterus albus]
MQKGFIFSMLIWNLSIFASREGGTYHLQFSLGCRAVIPCEHKRRDSNSFKWFYKKDEHSEKIQIFFEDKKGLQHHYQFRPRGRVTQNRSLVISDFTEDDQGLYWCENCYKDRCSSEQTTVIKVDKEILDEIHETVYVTADNSFTHVCPGEFRNFKWTFEASNTTAFRNSVRRPETDFVTSSKSIHIKNVKGADAGKYTCWMSRCGGHRQKLLTINLCVMMVHQNGDSLVSCAMICDMEFSNIKPNSMSNEETGTRAPSVHVDSYEFLNCSTKQMFDIYNVVHASNASNKTTGHTENKYLTAVISGTSVTLMCLILMALLIFCSRPRLWAELSDCSFGIDGKVEEDTSIVYSSVMFRRPAKTTNNDLNSSECVYSEIKV